MIVFWNVHRESERENGRTRERGRERPFVFFFLFVCLPSSFYFFRLTVSLQGHNSLISILWQLPILTVGWLVVSQSVSCNRLVPAGRVAVRVSWFIRRLCSVWLVVGCAPSGRWTTIRCSIRRPTTRRGRRPASMTTTTTRPTSGGSRCCCGGKCATICFS